MPLLTKAEHKFGRFAIPGLLRIIAGFQLLVFVLAHINPSFLEVLALDPARVMKGEVWRLVSYVFIPRTLSFWIIIQVMFLWFINDGLESAWGSFRLNLYFIGSMLTLTLGCFFLPGVIPTGEFLYYSVFLAFAIIYPEQTIMFMLVIPIKIKYLAYLLGGILVLYFFQDHRMALTITCSLIPFACYALPKAIRTIMFRSQVAERRHRYEQHSLPANEAFHRCTACGKTEADDPHLEFRVTSEGDELCVPCLERQKTAGSKENATETKKTE